MPALACASGSETSNAAGTECVCSSGHYLGNDHGCLPCDGFADCSADDERLGRLLLDPGYWRMTNWSADARECPTPDACVGGRGDGNDSAAFDAEQYCADGYFGPLCASCDGGFAPQEDGTCVRCSSAVTTRAAIAMAAVVLVVFALWRLQAGAASRAHAWQETHPRAKKAVHAVAHKAKIVLSMLQIGSTMPRLFVTVAYPKVYAAVFAPLGLLSIDLVPVLASGCMYAPSSFHQELLVATVLPLVLAALLALWCMMQILRGGDARTGHFSHAFYGFLVLTYLVLPSVSTKIFMTFACDEFEDGTFDDSRPRRFLKADYRVDCNSDVHEVYRAYAYLMLLVYPIGIPAMYLALLWRNRATIDPAFDEGEIGAAMKRSKPANGGKPKLTRVHTFEGGGDDVYSHTNKKSSLASMIRRAEMVAGKDDYGIAIAGADANMSSLNALVESLNALIETRKAAADDAAKEAFGASIAAMKQVLAAELRSHDPSIAYLEFLWGGYAPRCWYWEAVESLRRLMLTGLLVFCMPDSATQIVIGILVSVFSIFFYSGWRPYFRPKDGALAEYAQYSVFVCLFSSLLLFMHIGEEDGYGHGDAIFGVSMVGVHVLVAVVCLGQIVFDYQAEEYDHVKEEYRHRGAVFLLCEVMFPSRMWKCGAACFVRGGGAVGVSPPPAPGRHLGDGQGVHHSIKQLGKGQGFSPIWTSGRRVLL